MPYFVTSSERGTVPLEELIVTPEGIRTPGSFLNPLCLEGVYHSDRELELSAAQREQALVEITLVQVEYLARRFLKDKSVPPAAVGTIIVYGSSSLTLTILPSRISHDVDLVVGPEFQRFLQAVCLSERPSLGQLELNTANPIVLRYCGNYRERTRKILTTSPSELMPIEVLHPLDTLSQKLLRVLPDVFEEKDKPDIQKIVEKEKPSRETLLAILRESFERYTAAAPEQVQQASLGNTRWLFEKFFDGIDIENEIVKVAKTQFERELESADLAIPNRLSVKSLEPRPLGSPELAQPKPDGCVMKPAYFHYLNAQDPLNEILDHYVKKRELTDREAQILRERAIEKEPQDDRVRRLARALLALSLDSETTNDYPLTQALRRLRAGKQ